MKQCAEGLEKIAATGTAQQLPPGPAIGMAIGADVPPPIQPRYAQSGLGQKGVEVSI